MIPAHSGATCTMVLFRMGIIPEIITEMLLFMDQVAFQTGMLEVSRQISHRPRIE